MMFILKRQNLSLMRSKTKCLTEKLSCTRFLNSSIRMGMAMFHTKIFRNVFKVLKYRQVKKMQHRFLNWLIKIIRVIYHFKNSVKYLDRICPINLLKFLKMIPIILIWLLLKTLFQKISNKLQLWLKKCRKLLSNLILL